MVGVAVKWLPHRLVIDRRRGWLFLGGELEDELLEMQLEDVDDYCSVYYYFTVVL